MITRSSGAWTLLLGVASWASVAEAQDLGCLAPIPPFLPSDAGDVRVYADLLREDFETYIADFEAYLACLDAERTRVLEEARAVVHDYGRLQELTRETR